MPSVVDDAALVLRLSLGLCQLLGLRFRFNLRISLNPSLRRCLGHASSSSRLDIGKSTTIAEKRAYPLRWIICASGNIGR